MRFRLTIFLLAANLALFFSIWFLSRERLAEETVRSTVPFTMLEIDGKTLDKPRILKLEGSKWRIVSPIDWPANLFAVNRIGSQLEFLDKETSFSLDEVSKYGHSLADYGLDDPVYTFKYGNGEVMYTLKIGKSLPVGDRRYMLDESNDRIIIVDQEFVDSLVVDMERLRNQNVFDIPRFEVTAFSVRLPVEGQGAGKANFRRIGLVRDGGKWKFETPIVADADPYKVDEFLNKICQINAQSFTADGSAVSGFDISSLPATITLQGTNRRQVLMLGNKTKDGDQIYAKLEDNPTIFTLDASAFKDIGEIQTALREKSFFKFDANQAVGLDISKDGKSVKLRKLKSGVWDVIGANGSETLTANADLAVVNDLIAKLEKVRSLQFVNDAPGDDLSQYGLGANSKALDITVTLANQSQKTLSIGEPYKYENVTLMYARADGEGAVYGIPRELSETASTDFLHYRSRILEILPEKAVITSLKIKDEKSGKELFAISAENGSFSVPLSKLGEREAAAALTMMEYCRRFIVGDFTPQGFSPEGVEIGGAREPWSVGMEVSVELPGGGTAATSETRQWMFTKRLGGTLQYGGAKKSDAVFTLAQPMIDSLFELTQEKSAPEELVKKTEPVPPDAQ